MKRVEPPTRTPPSVFEKVLRAFESGDFAYTEVLAQLRQELGAGASPSELMEIMRRHELDSPLPPYAHSELIEILEHALAVYPAHAVVAGEGHVVPAAAPPGVFDKILGAFETGGFTLDDVLAQLQRLLSTGTSPTELLEVLRRRESVEPLPALALGQIVALINDAIGSDAKPNDEAPSAPPRPSTSGPGTRASGLNLSSAPTIRGPALGQGAVAVSARTLSSLTGSVRSLEEQIARQNADYEALARSHERIRDAEMAASARAAALATDLTAARAALESERSRARAAAKESAESMALVEATRARGEESLRESGRYQVEARAMSETLAAKDAALIQVRRSLGEREAQLASLQQEHATVVPTLEARAAGADKTEAALLATRAALEAEQRRARTLDEALAENVASAGAARAASAKRAETDLATARAALEAEQRRARTLDEALAEKVASADAAQSRAEESLRERDAQLAALQEERAALRPALEVHAASATQMEADLARARAALEVEQRRSQTLGEALAEKVASAEAARSRVEESLREREAQLAALKQEHAAAHAALGTELRKSRTLDEALAESVALADVDQTRMQDTLRAREAELAKLAALQQEYAAKLPALQGRADMAGRLERDLQALRAHADSIAAELRTSRDTCAGLAAQLERSQASLDAARTELGAAKTQSSSRLEALQTREWRREFDDRMTRESDARVAAATAGSRAMQGERDRLRTERDHLQAEVAALRVNASAAAREADSAADTPPVRSAYPEHEIRMDEPPEAQAAPMADLKAERRNAGPSKFGMNRLYLGGGAALLAIAVTAGFIVHKAPSPVPPRPPSVAPLPTAGSAIRDCPTCPGMTILPTGRFKQGSDPAGSGSGSFAKPLHWVLIARPIAMSTNAVTVDEFQQFAADTGLNAQGCDIYDGEWKHRGKNNWKDPGFEQTGTHPVTCVSWNDAKAYAQWLTAKTGHSYRLPSASEWEYAARSGAAAAIPWSADGSGACASANVADQNAARRFPGWTVFACDDGYVYTAPVGSFTPNAFGLNDMLGNVFQWSEDCWHSDYVGAPIDGSARTDGDCSQHELRGGSWFSTPAYVRADYRNHFAADYRTSSVGIRLVREIEQ